jgi:hypothetical protein
MSSTNSSNLRIELIGTGDQSGTWGTTTNNNFAYVLDSAIAGYQTVSVSSAAQALTYLTTPNSTASANQSVYAMLRLTTSTTANFAVYAPPNSKSYIIWNDSGYTATLYNSTVIGNTTAAGTGVAIPNGAKYIVFSNGTNFYNIDSSSAAGVTSFSAGTTGLTPSTGTTGAITLAGTLAIGNGGTGQTTANAALNALLPSQSSNNNKVLLTDGSNSSWASIVNSLAAGTGITVSAATGSITVSIPQAITTASSVQFGSFGVGTAASGTTGEIRATNNITAYYSDDRLKTKLGGIDNALGKLNSLSGFYYEANDTAKALGYEAVREVGVSAQQVQAVMPEVVAPAPIDDKYLTVRYERLVPLLIEAIKELTAKVEALEAK